MKPLVADWYAFPQYYDLAFRSETQPEADFITAACSKYCPFPVVRLLEPGCGSGRLVVELAARGYRMVGLDLSRPSLLYLRRKLQRRGLEADIGVADIATFHLPDQVDAAFCTFNTFRHLLTEATARSHLECIVRALRPGGIYILGFHLLPYDVSEEDCERWTVTRGHTRVTVTLRVLATDRRARIEQLRVALRVRSPRQDLALRSDFPLRMYTLAQFRRLLRRVPALELVDVYDFWYDINQRLRLTEEMTDTVFILRRRD